MPVHPFLIEQVLTLPEGKDVRNSPIVTAIILGDSANAASLVPYLDRTAGVVSINARRILCLFDYRAVPHIAAALATCSVAGRMDGLDVIWTLLINEQRSVVRSTLATIAKDLDPLFADKRSLPIELPLHIERDFLGRICDLTFLVVAELLDPDFDQSSFRAVDEESRDRHIADLKRKDFGSAVV